MSSSESSSSSHSGSGSSGFGFSASAPHKASPTPPPLRITTTSLMPQAPQLNNSNPDAVAIDNVFLSSPALNSANMIFGDTKSANSSDNSKTNLAFLSPRMSRGPNAPPKSADSRGSTPSLFRLMKKSGKGADKKHNSQMEISVENEHPLKSGYSNNSLPRKYLSSSHSSFEQKSVNSLRAFGDVQRSSHKKIISMPTKNNNHSSSSASLKKSESYALQQSEKSPTSLIEQISSSVLNMSPFDISNFNALKNADDIRSTMKPIGNDSRIFSENEKVQNAVKNLVGMVTYTSFTGSLNKILQVSEDLKSSSNDTPPTEKQSVSSFQIPLGLIAKTSFNSSINEKNLMVSSPTDGSLSLLENNAAQSLSSDKASGDLMLLSGGGAGGGFGSDEKKRKESIDIIRTSLGGIPSHRHRAFSDYNSNSNQASQIRGGSISSRTSSNNNNSSNNRSKGSVQSSASSVAGKRVVQTSLGHITFDSIVPRNPTLKSTTNNNNLNFSRQLSSPSPPARQDNAAQGHRREDSSGIGFPRPSETVTTATTTTDLVLNNIYARRKSVTPLKPAAERVTIEEEAQKNAAAAYIEKSQKQAGTETVSPPASKSTIDFVGYKTKPEKSFIESLRVPIDESPETKWDLKFSTEVENLYTVYAYHLIGRMNVLPMAIFCILWLAFVVLEFFSYSSFQPARAIIAIFPAATTLLITIWSRFSSYEKYHKRANVIWAITLSMELISATIHEYFLFKNTNDQNGITPDRFPSVLALALIGSVYLTVSTRFTRLFIIATTLTLFQTAMEFAICAKSGSNISYISAVQNSLLYFVMNTIGVYFRFSSEVYLRRAFVRYQKQYSSAEKLLIAQQHSEHLLGMIFPSKIISTLKKLDLTGSEKASLHDTFLELKGVTILFADIVGFTEFSSQVPQSKLIRLLGEIFAEFDSIAHDMDLEKIKTIGDCVQIAGGVPDQLQSEAAIMENAEKVVLAGLLMIKSITAITFKSGCLLKLRVGIHSGDVIAGIIGLWKFKYDLWGTDVDVASAIEQSGKENTPHISEDTFDLLKTNALFTFSKSEPLEVAGSRVFNTFDVRYAESRTGRSLVEWREVVATMYRRAVIENQLSSSDGSGGLNHQIDIVDNESLLQHQQPAAIYTTSPTPPSYNRQSCLATAESGFLTFDEPAVAFTVPSLSVQSSPVNGLVGGGGGQRMQFSYSDNNYRSRSNLDLLNGNMRDVDISVPIQTRSKMSQTMLQFSVETNPLTNVFTLSTKEQGYEIDYLRHHAGSQTVSAVVLVSCYVVMVIASKLGGSQSSVFYHHIIIFAIMILLVVTAYFVNHPYRKRILIESKLLNSSGRALPNSTNISGGIFNRATENKYLVANTGVADFTKLNSSGEAVSAAAAAVTSSASMPTNLNGVWVEEAYLDIPERFLWFTPNLVAVLLIWLALFGLLLDYCIDFNTNFTIYRLMFNIVELHLLFVGLKMYYMNGSLLVCIAALVATFVSIGQGDSNSYALLNRYQLFIIFSMYAVLVILNNYRIDRVSRLNYFMKIENDKVFEQTRAAKQGTESLLLNILPLKAVQKLKEDPTHQIADEKPDVAIMFVSICSFEKLHKLNAIWNLNDIICDFDECCPLFGVEKIKTIGTRYMVMCEPNDISAGGGGVDSTTSSLATSEHIIRLINFSLKLQEVINDFNKRTNNAFTLRAGISAGPVAAGVIGTKTFTYDVWGDVVNVASRMESTGIEGHLQLTETVYHRINNGAGVVGKFRFLSRGAVFVKGKGDMSTHLLDIQSPNGGGGAVGSGHIIRKSSLKHMDSSKRLSVSFPQGSCGGGSIGGERERRPSEQQRRPSLLKQAIEKNAMESESRCASILQPSEFPPSLFAQVSGSGAVGYIMTSAEMSIGSRRSSSAAVAVGGSMFAGGIREATGISLGNISEQAGSSMQSENSVEQQPQEAEEEKRVSLGRPASRKGSFSLGRSPVMRPSVLRELARADTEAAEDGHAYKSKIQENEEEDVEKVMKEEEEEDEKPVRFSKVRSSSYSSTSNSPPKRPSTWYAGRPSIAEDVS